MIYFNHLKSINSRFTITKIFHTKMQKCEKKLRDDFTSSHEIIPQNQTKTEKYQQRSVNNDLLNITKNSF